ncbi:hypothetical protein B296_00013969 [Ensete ventricosum]|uniref:Uncharacterized protein n=1 Tax=Ensete ventricosum TaxID=4639 RepID=A0A427A5Z4_ENSVE|nr:hypothetical protein B296_00013969 [Ensete ventricosum]
MTRTRPSSAAGAVGHLVHTSPLSTRPTSSTGSPPSLSTGTMIYDAPLVALLSHLDSQLEEQKTSSATSASSTSPAVAPSTSGLRSFDSANSTQSCSPSSPSSAFSICVGTPAARDNAACALLRLAQLDAACSCVLPVSLSERLFRLLSLSNDSFSSISSEKDGDPLNLTKRARSLLLTEHPLSSPVLLQRQRTPGGSNLRPAASIYLVGPRLPDEGEELSCSHNEVLRELPEIMQVHSSASPSSSVGRNNTNHRSLHPPSGPLPPVHSAGCATAGATIGAPTNLFPAPLDPPEAPHAFMSHLEPDTLSSNLADSLRAQLCLINTI